MIRTFSCPKHGPYKGRGWGAHRRRCRLDSVTKDEYEKGMREQPVALKSSGVELAAGRDTIDGTVDALAKYKKDLDREIMSLEAQIEENKHLEARLKEAKRKREKLVRSIGKLKSDVAN